jgi:hypothetical protein
MVRSSRSSLQHEAGFEKHCSKVLRASRITYKGRTHHRSGILFFAVASLAIAVHGHCNNEPTAVSNLVLNRKDHLGCDKLVPVDFVEQRLQRSPAAANGLQ